MPLSSVVIGGESALAYLRAARCGELLSEGFCRPIGGMLLDPTPLVRRALTLTRSCAPLHVVVPSTEKRPVNPLVRAHVWGGPMPDDEVGRLDTGVFVCGPRLAFLQCAARLDIVDLALIAYELTGTYALRSWDDGANVSLAEPATTKEGLRAFATACTSCGVRGAGKALRALELVEPLSNSAAESLIALQMKIKGINGGFGIGDVELNPRIPLPAEVARLQGRDELRPDFRARGPRGAEALIEYESEELHVRVLGAPVRDSKRRDSFTLAGHTVYTLMKEQVKDADYLWGFMEKLRRDLGLRPCKSRWDRFLALHRRLHVDRTDPLAAG